MIPLRAWWQLCRVPNLFTAAADIGAGYLFTGGDTTHWQTPALLMIAAMCLYAGGVVLNDVYDADRDAMTRRDRPIPSGQVSRRHAACVGATLLVAGWALAAAAGGRAALTAGLLAFCILVYDGWAKQTRVAPAVMGLCRALNLMLGMVDAPAWPADEHLFAAAMMWLYVSSVTLFARREAEFAGMTHIRIGWIGAAAGVAGLGGLPCFMDAYEPVGRVMVGTLLLTVVLVGRPAARAGSPHDVQRAVTVYVLAIIAFDACLACTARGLMPAGVILTLLIPAVLLARAIRVT